MPSDSNIPLNPEARHGSPVSPPPIPSFGMLPRGSMLRQMKSNFAECITAPPRGVISWQFAAMFRSAYFPKRFPTRPLLQSILLHVCVLTYWTSRPPEPPRRSVDDEIERARSENRVIYYAPAERLPAVSPSEPEPPPRPQSPRVRLRMARGPERVVSRPPRPDNSRQTIVQPEAPQLKLPSDVEVPNLVAWSPAPPPPSPSVSIPQPQRSPIPAPRIAAPRLPAPTPEPPKLAMADVRVPAAPAGAPNAPVPPRPSVAETQRQVAQIRVPRLVAPFVPAPTPEPPKLTLPNVDAPAAPSAGLPSAPVPPRPSVADAQQQVADLRVPQMPNLVAVGVAPAPPPVRIEIPLGNRAGEFAISPDGENLRAGPSGRPGEGAAREAPSLPQFGTVGDVADIRVPNLSIAGDRGELSPPPAPVVAEAPEARIEPRSDPRAANRSPLRPESDLRTLMARAARPALPDMTRGRSADTLPEVFGDRRIYTVYINMPNLASGAGSWILRFAERDGDGSGRGDGGEEIASPVAVKKVDPMYAPAAIRERVEGTVTLAAQILRSGKVTSVRVVQGVDPRLDLSAVQALTLWQFEPARKKGVPIDLEVVVQIPFRLPAF